MIVADHDSLSSIIMDHGLGKSSVRDIITKMLSMMLSWSEMYIAIPSEQELQRVTRQVVNDPSLYNALFVVDSVPTRINDPSGLLWWCIRSLVVHWRK